MLRPIQRMFLLEITSQMAEDVEVKVQKEQVVPMDEGSHTTMISPANPVSQTQTLHLEKQNSLEKNKLVTNVKMDHFSNIFPEVLHTEEMKYKKKYNGVSYYECLVEKPENPIHISRE
ncbi:hypothetical protein NPIL_21041 [Nephila pilipes]|uniref:Uncharacterized protein n=1 Tax=Nephila pilipes TaxID=299642 RepID=A0A8X6TVL9_NEPPI|nr:hypothetical protein NPIL_21041 [Nephila pilipes]